MSLKTVETARSGTAGGEDVVVPGSVANLGGGFDTLGVAVGLYLRVRLLEVRDDGRSSLTVARSDPPITGGNAIERAFDIAVRRSGRRPPSAVVEAVSEIPVASGLGSSAAATVAGLRVFERLAGQLDDGELLAAATEAEGHGDNAAPALFGGLTSVVEVEDGPPLALRWSWPDGLRLVVGTPAATLPTAAARAALRDAVPRADAVFNLQHVLALVHALQHRDYPRLREAVKDRLHQPARAALVPLLDEVLALQDPDVPGAFLAGAGPSVALVTPGDAGRVERLLASMYARAGVEATIRTLDVHHGPSGRPARPAAGMRSTAEAVASAHGRTV